MVDVGLACLPAATLYPNFERVKNNKFFDINI